MAVYTAVDDAGLHYNAKLYTGTGSSLGVTGVGFQPDFTWIKNRDADDFHVLTDAVRGVTKYWQSNSTAAEVTNVESLKSFDSDGFTVGTQAEVNTNTEDYCSWNWKAGTTTGIAGSPTITPTSYSFNQTAGFSIIAYTGTGVAATLPHGLGVAPKMIIVKKVGGIDGGIVYHASQNATPEDYYLVLSSTAAAADNAFWNDTAPTSTLFSIGTLGDVNTNTETYIAYCFAEVQGFSKFGSYVGNNNADGTFVYTGFKPKFVLIKMYTTAGTASWTIYDGVLNPFNGGTTLYLFPNTNDSTSNVDAFSGNCDFLSNGFKLRTAGYNVNDDTGWEYIFAAFAEAPFVNSSGVPVNAR